MSRRHESGAWIRNQRRARIRHERNRFALLQAIHQLRYFRVFVMFVKARRRRRDRVVLEEPVRSTGVLGRNQCDFPEDPKRTKRDILQVADRCGDNVEGAGHDSPGDCTKCIQLNRFRTSLTNIWRTSTKFTRRTRRLTASTFTTTCSKISPGRRSTRKSGTSAVLRDGWRPSIPRG